MSVRLFLDECALDKRLASALRVAGFDVETVTDINFLGRSDEEIFEHCTAHNRVLITHNVQDFEQISDTWKARGRSHSGIFCIFKYNNPKKDLTPDLIVRAIQNVCAADVQIADSIIELNWYNYDRANSPSDE